MHPLADIALNAVQTVSCNACRIGNRLHAAASKAAENSTQSGLLCGTVKCTTLRVVCLLRGDVTAYCLGARLRELLTALAGHCRRNFTSGGFDCLQNPLLRGLLCSVLGRLTGKDCCNVPGRLEQQPAYQRPGATSQRVTETCLGSKNLPGLV